VKNFQYTACSGDRSADIIYFLLRRVLKPSLVF
jgi:hypothetical protein